MIYKNKQDFNDGIRLKGQTPVDDRLVAESVTDLYITTTGYASHDLYNRAYRGMTVTVVNTNDIYICFNAAPYTPGSVVTVNASNFGTYWKRVSMLADDSGDMPTIKILNDKITGGKYKITKLPTPPDGMYSSYKLQYAKPGDSNYNDISGSVQLDIPLIEVVKEVHLCKRWQDSSGEWHVIYQDDPDWSRYKNKPMYIHIIWDIKDPESAEDDGRETFIPVDEMLVEAVDNINASIADLSTYVRVDQKNYIDDLSTNVYTTIGNQINNLNSSITDLSTYVRVEQKKYIDDLSTNVYTTIAEQIDNLNSSITDLSTNVYTTITEQIDNLNSSITDLSTYVRVDQKNYIDDLSTNVHTTIANQVNNLNSSIADLSSNVNTTINSVSTNLATFKNNVSTNELAWAAAWNQLFALNPTLVKPSGTDYPV